MSTQCHCGTDPCVGPATLRPGWHCAQAEWPEPHAWTLVTPSRETLWSTTRETRDACVNAYILAPLCDATESDTAETLLARGFSFRTFIGEPAS